MKLRNKITIAKTSLLFLFFCICMMPQTAHAALPLSSIRVSPIISDLLLTPGKATSFPVTIENISNAPVGIHILLSGFDETGDSSLIEQKPSAIVTWTRLSKEDMVIGAHGQKNITVTIEPPKSIGQSGYYETIFLTPIFNQQQSASTPIILSRFGILVLGTIGNLNYADLAKKVMVSNFSPSDGVINSFPKDISFTVFNKYFTHFDAKPFLTITPLFGNAQTTLLIDKHVLPQDGRIWHYQPTVPENHIFYTMHLAVSIGDGKQIFANSWFIVLPYKKVFLLIVLLVIMYFVIFKRDRLKKFVRILLRG